ncbi:prepilin-type cleavage/methylation domain-containing protein, partial [Alkalihalobacillus oceani]|nr:prepilin-type cleavage/methylation domain-containing protein [Halalkalibacter oceani]
MTGGIAGSWSGAMTESYSSVDVKGGTDTGGIIGEGTAAACQKVYATGDVEGATKVGGLIG